MNIFNIIKRIFNNKIDNIEDLEQYYLEKSKNDFVYQDKYRNQEEILLKYYNKCDDKLNGVLKAIIIADTHGSLNEEELVKMIENHKDYDICILLGDHTSRDLEIILNYIPKSKIYALLGNHDSNYIDAYNLTNLNGNIFNINNISFTGICGSYKYKPVSFPSFTQQESISFLKDLDRVDILFSHDSPFNSNITNPAHQGLFGITYYLYKNKVLYNVHGHIHENYEKVLLNNTKEISLFGINYYEFK